MNIPRMSYPQYRKARRLTHECCNYCNGNCLLLDDGEGCVCVQSISYSLLCRWFKVAVLPLERGLVFDISQFQHHRPELLVGGEVFYQQCHIPKAAFCVFQGGGRRVAHRADLGQPAFQALVAVNLVFRDEV